jgi:hypothetical protein
LKCPLRVNITFGLAIRQHHFIGGPPDIVPGDGEVVISTLRFSYNEADLDPDVLKSYSVVKLDLTRKERFQ